MGNSTLQSTRIVSNIIMKMIKKRVEIMSEYTYSLQFLRYLMHIINDIISIILVSKIM